MPRATRHLLLVLAPLLALAGCGGNAAPRAGDQLSFGVDMARRGLWSEAYFRFQQAERISGQSPQVLNNLAVAAEALGRFDEALGYYRQALALTPGDRDLRSNYDRFISFYESFRALAQEQDAERVSAAAAQSEEAEQAEPAEPEAEPPSPAPPESPPTQPPPTEVPPAGPSGPQPPGEPVVEPPPDPVDEPSPPPAFEEPPPEPPADPAPPPEPPSAGAPATRGSSR